MCDFPISKTKLDTLQSNRKLFKWLIVEKHILSGEIVLWVFGFSPSNRVVIAKLIWLIHIILNCFWPLSMICLWKVPNQNYIPIINDPLSLPILRKPKGLISMVRCGSVLLFGIWKADSFTFLRLEQQHHPWNISQKSYCCLIFYIAVSFGLKLMNDYSIENSILYLILH